MHWRLNKYVIEETIKFLRRILNYNSEWSNKDIELYKFNKGKEELVYEIFAEKEEKYPFIAVGTGGGNLIPTGFNDLVQYVDNDIYSLGQVKTNAILVNDITSIKSKLASSLNGTIIRGLDIESAWTGNGVGGDDINIYLYKNYQSSSASIVASASVIGHTSKEFVLSFVNFSNNVTLDASPYHLLINSTADSPYYIGLDNTFSSTYLYNNTGSDIEASGSITGNIYLPAFIRLGGNFKGSLAIKVMSKNDTLSVYNLSELISIYINLAKHAKISRDSDATDGMKINDSIIGEFLSKGINTDQIKISSLEIRKRSEQEIIYTITITIDFLTEWFQDFPAEIITDIDLLIKTFLGEGFEEAWSSTEV